MVDAGIGWLLPKTVTAYDGPVLEPATALPDTQLLFEWITSTDPCTPLPTTLSWSMAKQYQRALSRWDRVCLWCREPINPNDSAHAKAAATLYCSNKCRILSRNPMEREDARQSMSSTLRRIGHRPKVRGGNGHGMTEPQQKLLDALPMGWVAEHVCPTGARIKGGPPTHYKLDLAHPVLKIAVEIDGGSHGARARRLADQRKDQWLSDHGWSVLRFSNQEVLSSISSVTAQISSTPLK